MKSEYIINLASHLHAAHQNEKLYLLVQTPKWRQLSLEAQPLGSILKKDIDLAIDTTIAEGINGISPLIAIVLRSYDKRGYLLPILKQDVLSLLLVSDQTVIDNAFTSIVQGSLGSEKISSLINLAKMLQKMGMYYYFEQLVSIIVQELWYQSMFMPDKINKWDLGEISFLTSKADLQDLVDKLIDIFNRLNSNLEYTSHASSLYSYLYLQIDDSMLQNSGEIYAYIMYCYLLSKKGNQFHNVIHTNLTGLNYRLIEIEKPHIYCGNLESSRYWICISNLSMVLYKIGFYREATTYITNVINKIEKYRKRWYIGIHEIECLSEVCNAINVMENLEIGECLFNVLLEWGEKFCNYRLNGFDDKITVRCHITCSLLGSPYETQINRFLLQESEVHMLINKIDPDDFYHPFKWFKLKEMFAISIDNLKFQINQEGLVGLRETLSINNVDYDFHSISEYEYLSLVDIAKLLLSRGNETEGIDIFNNIIRRVGTKKKNTTPSIDNDWQKPPIYLDLIASLISTRVDELVQESLILANQIGYFHKSSCHGVIVKSFLECGYENEAISYYSKHPFTGRSADFLKAVSRFQGIKQAVKLLERTPFVTWWNMYAVLVIIVGLLITPFAPTIIFFDLLDIKLCLGNIECEANNWADIIKYYKGTIFYLLPLTLLVFFHFFRYIYKTRLWFLLIPPGISSIMLILLRIPQIPFPDEINSMSVVDYKSILGLYTLLAVILFFAIFLFKDKNGISLLSKLFRSSSIVKIVGSSVIKQDINSLYIAYDIAKKLIGAPYQQAEAFLNVYKGSIINNEPKLSKLSLKKFIGLITTTQISKLEIVNLLILLGDITHDFDIRGKFLDKNGVNELRQRISKLNLSSYIECAALLSGIFNKCGDKDLGSDFFEEVLKNETEKFNSSTLNALQKARDWKTLSLLADASNSWKSDVVYAVIITVLISDNNKSELLKYYPFIMKNMLYPENIRLVIDYLYRMVGTLSNNEAKELFNEIISLISREDMFSYINVIREIAIILNMENELCTNLIAYLDKRIDEFDSPNLIISTNSIRYISSVIESLLIIGNADVHLNTLSKFQKVLKELTNPKYNLRFRWYSIWQLMPVISQLGGNGTIIRLIYWLRPLKEIQAEF
jgi:hypothetical protein